MKFYRIHHLKFVLFTFILILQPFSFTKLHGQTIFGPSDQYVCEDKYDPYFIYPELTFSVGSNIFSPTYQWYMDGVAVAGETESSFVLSRNEVYSIATKNLQVEIKCKVSAWFSRTATIYFTNKAPVISTQPQDFQTCDVPTGFTKTINVAANGSYLSYQWYRNDIAISGAIVDTYDVTETGNYYCVVSNICGTDESSEANIGFLTTPSLNTQPQDISVCEGENTDVVIDVSNGSGFEWDTPDGLYYTQENSFHIENITDDKWGGEYNVKILNGECSISTGRFDISVNPLPSFSLGDDLKVCKGESVVLSPDADFSSYKWSTEATTKTISVSTEGNYSLKVTDINGCENSDEVFVDVDNPITQVNLGNDKEYCSGTAIFLDAGQSYNYNWYKWSTGATSRSIDITESGKYWVKAGINGNVCETYDEVNITINEPFEDEEICMVSVDKETGKYLIIWEKTPDVKTSKYRVYRVTNTKELVKEVLYDDESIVLDEYSNPRSRADVYTLVTVDECGNESEESSYHKPFLLQTSPGLNDEINLQWAPYLVDNKEATFSSVEIYRGTDSTQLEHIYTLAYGLSNNSYVDLSPPKGVNLYYRIAGVRDIACDPNNLLRKKAEPGPFIHSLSNLEDTRIAPENINDWEKRIKIYPNPAGDFLKVNFNPEYYNKGTYSVYSLQGTIMQTGYFKGNEFTIITKNLTEGVYILHIRGNTQLKYLFIKE